MQDQIEIGQPERRLTRNLPRPYSIAIVLTFLLILPQVATAQDFENVKPSSGGEVTRVESTPEIPTGEIAGLERVTVVGPKSIRPNSDYNVLVNLADSQQPATIDLQLIGARDSNKEQTESKSVLVNSGETVTVKFQIGDWPPAEYVLSVTAQANDRSWNFTQEKILTYRGKKFSTFIQTDKAIYKPGQLVQFRAIFLTKSLTPHLIKDNTINVTIVDPKNNIVKQWQGLSNYRGLLSLDFQLSEDPMLGDWTIRVEAHQQETATSKRFNVAEYILPTFEVAIQLPTYATYNESDIVATVKATYTYGKPVKGHVTLIVQPLVRYQHLSISPSNLASYRARLEDGGSADIKVDLVKDLKLQKDGFEREIEFFALVEEDLTGRKYNKTNSMIIYEKNIKVELLNTDRAFMPGMTKQLQLKVAYQDDIPVEDNGPLVELKISPNFQGRTIETAKLQPVGGLIEHTLDTTLFKTNSDSSSSSPTSPGAKDQWPQFINLDAIYRGQKYRLASLDARRTTSGQYMQISAPQLQSSSALRAARRRNKQTGKYIQPALNINDDLKIRIRTTEPIQRFTCHGLAGGDIVWASNPNAQNKTQYEFDVKNLDQRVVPELKVLCYYIRPENREIIADSMVIPVDGLVRNSIKISASREEAKPGQEMDIDVQTRPNALIGLLAIDQSVLALRTGNDITQKDIKDEVKTYNGIHSDQSESPMITTEDVIDASDVVILTNNLIEYSRRPQLLYMSMLSSYSKFQSDLPERSSSKIVLDTNVLDRELEAPDFRLKKAQRSEPLVIRSFFPETWIWENATTDSTGRFSIKKKAPDTITSWVLSAFSIDEATGFGVTNSPTSVRIFRPFFIKLNLPYSIIRGETVNIQAVIFNYSKRPTSATVTLKNKNGDFEFIEAANNIDDEKRSSEPSESRSIKIPAEDGVSVSFLISPKKLGHIDIEMVARGEFAADGVLRKLLVKPEGQTQYLNKAMLINLARTKRDSSPTLTRNISIDVPANAVADSQKVYVSAVGDVMGAGLSNPDELLRLPDGCGEQNMINLVPNVVILNYLDSTKRLKSSQRNRAVRNIEAGYQRELNYKRKDGSFSAFGQSDANGSVWLTAYVLKTFQQAKKYITIDEKVIHRAANYIASLSKSDGSIKEVGMLHHKALASSSSENPNSVYLTAYSMIALLQKPISKANQEEVGPSLVALDEVIERGLNYLESRLDEAANQDSPYDLAIITYALHLANRKNSMDKAYDQLWLKAQESRDMIWWQENQKKKPDNIAETEETTLLERESSSSSSSSSSPSSRASRLQQTPPPLKPVPKNDKQSEHQFVPDSLAIEMTSLALLTIVKRGGNEVDRALPILNWLISKQNSMGGFASTQDTVLAIEALAAFAAVANANTDGGSSVGPSIDLDILYPLVSPQSRQSIRKNNVDQMLIKPSNALVNQRLQMPDNITWVQLQATGYGMAIVQVAWQYNLVVSAEKPSFYLNPILDKTSNVNYLQLSVCTFYKPAAAVSGGASSSEESSNMALMEVELPSGYTADLEALPGLKRIPDVKRVDTSDGDTKVIIYLDKVTREEICITIPAHRSSKVSNNKPTPVSIYDYYDRSKAARIFYEPLPASSCDICDSDDICSERCSLKPKTSGRLVQQVASLHEQRKQNPVLSAGHGLIRDGDHFANLSSSPNDNSPIITNGPKNHTTLPLERVLNAAIYLVHPWGR